MTSQTINLNLIPGGITPVIHVSQYDKGQTWTFNLYAGSQPFSIPANSSVVILGTKKDKTGFEYACSYSGNVVTAIEQQQMTILAGDVPAEIRITKGNDLIGSMNFIIKVEAAALTDETQISETDLPLIEEAIEELERVPAIITQMETLAQQASTSATTATTKAGEASTSATNAAASATSAAGSASTATTKAGQASTSATNAANSATSASNSATSAAGSASTATTKAGEAATSATNAAASAQQAQQAAASLTVDSALSSTSTNPVQNKIVKGEFDSVKQALSNEVVTRATLGAHNLAAGKFSVYSSYGVTFTPQADGSVIAYSANAPSDAVACSSSVFTLKAGSYVLGKNLGERENVQLLKASDNSSIAFANLGNDVPFTLNADTEVKIVLYAYSAHGAYNNVVYKPFIRLASDAITEWSSPVPTNSQLLSADVNAELGAHNLLPLSLATVKSLNTAGTWSGNKYTASNNACDFTVNTDSKGNVTSIGVEVKAVSASDMGLALSKENFGNADFNTNSTPTANGYTISYGDTNNNFRLQYLASNTLTRIVVLANTPVSTKTMYPMIRHASDPSTKFTPYAMTNKELTDELSIVDGTSLISVDTTKCTDGGCSIYKMGHLVQVDIALTAITTTGTWAYIATLPYKPIKSVAIPLANSGYTNWNISDAGKIQRYAAANNESLYAHVVYFTND